MVRRRPAQRVVATAAALALLAAVPACGSNTKKSDGHVSTGPVNTRPNGAPSGGSANTQPSDKNSSTTKPKPEGPGGPPTTGSTASSRPGPATTANVDPPPGNDDGSRGGPGDFARTILRPQPATSVVIERSEQPGAEARQTSFDHAKSVLQAVASKPTAVQGPIALGGGAKHWTAADIRATADRTSAAGQGNGRAVIHVLFLKGTFTDDAGEDRADVLGVTVRGDVLAVFSDSVASAASPVVSRRDIEDAVLMHELGHVLGLVDLALKTGRDDSPDHPHHSKNKESVMYWAVESSLIGQVLGGAPPKDFDQADLADLRALRSGS
jgi:hypothetical protein